MQDNWQEIKLEDYCNKITVGHVGSMASRYVLQGIPFLRSLNIKAFELNLDNLVFIDKNFNESLRKSQLMPGDVVVVRTGYPGTACVIPIKMGIANCSDLVIIRSGENIDPYFIEAVFNSSWGKESVGGATVGAAQQHFNIGTAKRMKFFAPDYETQKTIGGIIRNYSDLIEVNNQRIKLLEETARELYKEWFVRMRFPGYKKAKFSKGIPIGWSHLPIGKVIDYNIGGGWGNESRDNTFSTPGYVIRGTDIPTVRSGKVNVEVYRFHKPSNMKSRELIEGDIVFETAGGSEGQLLGRTCYITKEILNAYGDKVICASFCKLIRTSSIPSLYLYYFINYLYETGMIETFQTQSTGISNYQFEPFLRFQEVLLPDEDLMKSFHNQVLVIQKQIAILGAQSMQLYEIRDRLLPRLISGKLQVKSSSEAKVIPINQSLPTLGRKPVGASSSDKKSNPYFKRAVLAAYLVDRLHKENTFGHVKLMKLMYLCEHVAHIETISNYHRDAAGPYDNQMIRSIDSQLKKSKWFECKNENGRFVYSPLSKKEEYKNWFAKYYSNDQAGIDKLIDLFGKQKTEAVEIVATLLEAHRSLQSKNDKVTDDKVVHEVLNNWHESKKRIEEKRWRNGLVWMRQRSWIE